MQIDFNTIATASPTVLYLCGVLYLFRENQKQAAKMEKLVERYHMTLLDGISMFKDIQRTMEDKND